MRGKKSVPKYIVTRRVCCGFVDASFGIGTVLLVDLDGKTFVEESTGKKYDDVRDVAIAIRNGIVVPWTKEKAEELAALAPPRTPAKKAAKPPMKVIQSDDDENRTIDIRWTKKPPAEEKKAGAMTVVRETHSEAMRGMTVVRSGEESDGIGSPINAAPPKKGSGIAAAVVTTRPSSNVPPTATGKFKAPSADAAAKAKAAKDARLKSVQAGERVLQPV